MLEVIIIDDEAKAIKSLKWELENFCKNIKVLDVFTDAEKALHFLRKNIVDAIFLDIQMPKMDGFQFLDQLNKRDFAVVFTTAFDEFAIDAIKQNALDYLTKPIDTDDLIEAVKKIETHKNNLLTRDALEESLLANNEQRIKISVDGKLLFLEAAEIIYCESDGNYTRIYLENNQKLFVTKKLKEVQELLPTSCFFRVHNSYIVNLKKVKAYYKTDAYVELSNKKQIPVSRNKKSSFLDKI
ncbi:LytR/AlgR family response regulator transcription factor [Psychroflexus planctonicus]|uniref:DNA-binding response regulator n=1 Tax=Psychroflexus planctonicus TaxID=1526575 RepID=A0ABQ1SH93_9FLAO|nr:LytTR family DNA-binding domain-containing protein [Psychroflexus planctonicus]GGE34524.1 DNA-binding response regulator [Psychroflexus planctonicus]